MLQFRLATPSRTTVSYLLALAVIAGLAVATHVIVDSIVRQLEDSARVVNMSGRQRMLSQRIAGLALELSQDAVQDGERDPSGTLRGAVDLMAISHAALTQGSETLGIDISRDSAAIRAMYFDPPNGVDTQVQAYLAEARRYLDLPPNRRAGSASLGYLLSAAQRPILSALDAVARQYQVDSEESIGRLRQVLLLTLALMLATLVAEAIFIFRPLLRRLVSANDRLRASMAESERRRAQVAALLNNSGQGFMAFGADLVVDDQHSRACADLLETAPAGRDAGVLLFPDDPKNAELLRSVVSKALEAQDDFRRNMMMSLAPTRLQVGESVLKLELKANGSDRIMAILTDLTDEVALEGQVEEERQNLEMIVAGVVDRRNFFMAIEEFDSFEKTDLPVVLNAPEIDLDAVNYLFRRVHTCKGVFSQFGFPKISRALHDLETGLAAIRSAQGTDPNGPLSGAGMAELFRSAGLREAFEEDLTVVRAALGADYLEQGGVIPLPPSLAKAVSDLADRLLSRQPVDWTQEPMVALLHEMSRLSKARVQDVLRSYDRVVQQVAERLDKHIEPVVVSGPDVWVETDRFGPFLSSLVHVFRNAAYHGLEAPEERAEAAKPIAGSISCATVLADSRLSLTIEDDGRGIDREALRHRLSLNAADADPSDETILMSIFADGVSTASSVDDIAGRGVGLPAVKAAIVELGGRLGVHSTVGRGTRFVFEIPMGVEAA